MMMHNAVVTEFSFWRHIFYSEDTLLKHSEQMDKNDTVLACVRLFLWSKNVQDRKPLN